MKKMKMCETCPDEKYSLSDIELCVECQKSAMCEANSNAVLAEVRAMELPEDTGCPKCGSAEIEETSPQNLAKPDAYSLLAEVILRI